MEQGLCLVQFVFLETHESLAVVALKEVHREDLKLHKYPLSPKARKDGQTVVLLANSAHRPRHRQP